MADELRPNVPDDHAPPPPTARDVPMPGASSRRAPQSRHGRAWLRASQGALLASGAPLGWLGLRLLGGASPFDELAAHTGLYVYLWAATTVAFAVFGTLLGGREDALFALNATLAERAVTDSLTGLRNHQFFFARLDEELARHRRDGKPLSLVVIDIDHFKRVNDDHGHLAGDRMIAAVADAGRKVLRREETFARLGGEEFGILLPGLEQAEALQVAERVQKAIANACVTSQDGAVLRVTISLGVASAVQDSSDAAELYARADAALYDAKQRGRDQIAVR